MYVYLRLLSYLPFPVLFDGDDPAPPGFSRLITSRGYVVTGSGARVIVREQ